MASSSRNAGPGQIQVSAVHRTEHRVREHLLQARPDLRINRPLKQCRHLIVDPQQTRNMFAALESFLAQAAHLVAADEGVGRIRETLSIS